MHATCPIHPILLNMFILTVMPEEYISIRITLDTELHTILIIPTLTAANRYLKLGCSNFNCCYFSQI